MTIIDIFFTMSVAHKNKPALNEYTYADFFDACLRYMNALIVTNLPIGSRVGVYLENSPSFIFAVLGCMMAGYTAVPIQDSNSLLEIIEDCNIALIITDKETSSSIRHLSPNDCITHKITMRRYYSAASEDIALIIYTSGSSSKRKGVVTQHSNLFFVTDAICRMLSLTSADRILVSLPMSFDYGLYQVFLSIYCGAYIFVSPNLRSLSVRAKELLKQEITVFPATPPILSQWCSIVECKKTSLPKLRMITSTGEYFAPALIKRIMSAFPNTKIVPMYGLTECKRVSIMPSDAPISKVLSSVGKCLPNTHALIVDEHMHVLPHGCAGELIVIGQHVMGGYWGNNKDNKNFFFLSGHRALKTGDIMYMDDDGYLYFCYRKNGILKQNSYRVSASAIENCAKSYPGIVEACAINILVNGTEKIVCFYSGNADSNSLKLYCSKSLSSNALPKFFLQMQSLPLTNNGKYDRVSLMMIANKIINENNNKENEH